MANIYHSRPTEYYKSESKCLAIKGWILETFQNMVKILWKSMKKEIALEFNPFVETQNKLHRKVSGIDLYNNKWPEVL